MVFSAPQVVSAVAPVEEVVAFNVNGTDFVLVVKAHTGSNRRELEVFTAAEVISGTPTPTRVNVLNQIFSRTAALVLTNDTVRFYWNDRLVDPVSPITNIVDYNITANTVGPLSVLPFAALDPFLLDARTVDRPNEVIITYVTGAGANAFRVSTDLGLTWGDEQFVDPPAAQVQAVEANFDDPQGARQNVQVLQRRA
jgi:hypothetical protein